MEIEELPLNSSKIPVYLTDSRIHLIPFYPQFIEKYAEWMKDPQILIETGSDEMTIGEIQEIQEKYATNKNEHCFIIYYDPDNKFSFEDIRSDLVERDNLVNFVVGDINLFTTRDNEIEINVD